MPSADDIYNRLVDANTRLETIKNELIDVKNSVDAVKASVDTVNNTLNNGFAQLVTLGTYTNQALFQNSKQNDTMICILEHISQNTCALLNEAHQQTILQTQIERNAAALTDMYATVHADAALQREKLQKLQREIEACCPPPPPVPPCTYERCPAPSPLPPPPDVGRKSTN